MKKLIKLIIFLKYRFMSINDSSKVFAYRIINNNNLKTYSNLPLFLKKRIAINKEGIFSIPKDLFNSFNRDKFNSNELILKKNNYSILVYRLIEALGYEPKLLISISSFNSNTMCFFKHDGKLILFDGYRYKKYGSWENMLKGNNIEEKYVFKL